MKLSANRGPGRPPSGEEDKNRLYGAPWLMEQIASRTGIRQDLENVFDGNKDMVDDIMTLAMSPYMTNFCYSRLARHQEVYKFPSSRLLTPWGHQAADAGHQGVPGQDADWHEEG